MTLPTKAVKYNDASNGIEVDSTKAPFFLFHTEVDALGVLDNLGEQLRAARRQEAETMRYLKAAILASQSMPSDEERPSPTAIIGHSGLSRRTVYAILGEAAGPRVVTNSCAKCGESFDTLEEPDGEGGVTSIGVCPDCFEYTVSVD